MLAIAVAYKPRFQFKASFVIETILAPLRRFPTSFAFLFISLLTYFLSNKIIALKDLVFSEDAPIWQWPLRTLSSQLIYFNLSQFTFIVSSICAILFFIEKEVYNKKWATYILLFCLFNEIFLRTLAGILFLNTPVLSNIPLIIHLFPTHGGVILLTSLLGFSTVFLGNKRDDIFALGILFFIVSGLFSSLLSISITGPLLSSTFFVEGYILGKHYLNLQSHKDALISKNKNDDEVFAK
jgi:hypothetical protein